MRANNLPESGGGVWVPTSTIPTSSGGREDRAPIRQKIPRQRVIRGRYLGAFYGVFFASAPFQRRNYPLASVTLVGPTTKQEGERERRRSNYPASARADVPA